MVKPFLRQWRANSKQKYDLPPLALPIISKIYELPISISLIFSITGDPIASWAHPLTTSLKLIVYLLLGRHSSGRLIKSLKSLSSLSTTDLCTLVVLARKSTLMWSDWRIYSTLLRKRYLIWGLAEPIFSASVMCCLAVVLILSSKFIIY